VGDYRDSYRINSHQRAAPPPGLPERADPLASKNYDLASAKPKSLSHPNGERQADAFAISCTGAPSPCPVPEGRGEAGIELDLPES
jgi:hypothetical protein